MNSIIWFEHTIPIVTENPQTFPIEAYLNGIARKLEDARATNVEINNDSLTFDHSMFTMSLFSERITRKIELVSKGVLVIQRKQNNVTLKCKFGFHERFALFVFLFIAYNTAGSWKIHSILFSSIVLSAFYFITIYFSFKNFKELLGTERIIA